MFIRLRMRASFISGSTARVTNRQTDGQRDKTLTQANYDAKCSTLN